MLQVTFKIKHISNINFLICIVKCKCEAHKFSPKDSKTSIQNFISHEFDYWPLIFPGFLNLIRKVIVLSQLLLSSLQLPKERVRMVHLHTACRACLLKPKFRYPYFFFSQFYIVNAFCDIEYFNAI